MANWIDLGPIDDFPDSAPVCKTAGEKAIVIIKQEGAWHALANRCPHAGLPLGEGEVRGGVITCPFHGYTFDIDTGRNIDFPHDEPPAKTYPIRENAGRIEVQIDDPTPV